MNNSLKNLLIIGLIAATWIALEAFNQGFFGFLRVTEFVYWIYWLSGLRLVAIILFGWIGFWGVFIGYVIGGIFLRGFSETDALFLGFLSSLAPIIAYRFWQSATDNDDDFYDVNFVQLCYLVFLHSFLTALFRNIYFYIADRPYGMDQIMMTFSANVLGSFIFLYLLLFCNRLYKKIKKAF
jgi:hypothetical protein